MFWPWWYRDSSASVWLHVWSGLSCTPVHVCIPQRCTTGFHIHHCFEFSQCNSILETFVFMNIGMLLKWGSIFMKYRYVVCHGDHNCETRVRLNPSKKEEFGSYKAFLTSLFRVEWSIFYISNYQSYRQLYSWWLIYIGHFLTMCGLPFVLWNSVEGVILWENMLDAETMRINNWCTGEELQ